MAEKRVKTTASSSSTMAEEEDRISKLPDAIIIHILSFLPSEDVVTTSVLSQRWKLMWYLVPTLSFSDTELLYGKKFLDYVDNYLKHCKRGLFFMGDSVITSFKFRMICHGSALDHQLVNKWLAFAIENKVKEISITFPNNGCDPFPQSVMLNAIYLTILKLSRVWLDCCSFRFPSLKSLSLECVWFVEVNELFLGCPSLESLELHCCDLSTNDDKLYIRSLSLKFLEIDQPEIIVGQIEAVNLESLILKGVYFDKVNLSACKAITNLTLNCDWRMNDSSSVEYLISNLPLLENFTLEDYNKSVGLKHIKISSQSLKRFKLISKDEMIVILESTPKLGSFWYKGNINFSISMVESSNLLNGTFKILDLPENYDGNWFVSLMNFFVNLNIPWNTISLHVDSVEALIFPKYMKRICRSPLVNWEHITVFTRCNPERELELRNALLWISPSLKTLSIRE
ncbi:hypothetical protein CsatB_018512 [Cannabis sativa]